jgi:hypothetical protein
MKRARIAVLTSLVATVATVALFAVACGGKTDTTVTGSATSIQVMTTSTAAPAPTTTTAAAGTIEAYRTEMKALWDQYGSKLSTMDSALNMSDPTALTPAELTAVEGFVGVLRSYVTGLAPVKAPAELATAHAKYVDVLTRIYEGLNTFVTAAKAGDTAALTTAIVGVAVMAASSLLMMSATEATLSEALGFSLNRSSSSTSTTEAAGITDPLTYTDAKYGYTFQYPATWKVGDSASVGVSAGGGSTSTAGVTNPNGAQAGGEYIDLLMVSTFELNSAITSDVIPALEEELKNVIASLQAQQTDLQILSPLAQTEVAGMMAYTVTYTFTTKGVPATSALYFIFKDKMEYQVSLQAASADWEAYKPTLEAMLATFMAP